MSAQIAVEVFFGGGEHRPVRLNLPVGSTVQQAIEAAVPGGTPVEALQGRVGVYGRLCELGQILQAGDRVEIYRPLLLDPKEARRSRVSRDRRAQRIASGG